MTRRTIVRDLNVGRLALGGLVVLLACGDGGDGLSGDLVLADLSEEELIGLCEEGQADLAAEIGTPEEIGCLLQGIFAATLEGGTPETCEAARVACLASPPADSEFGTYECTVEELGSTEGCDVTVDELRACFADLNAQVSDVVETLSCALVADPDGLGDLSLDEDPASCAEIERRCPTL